MADPKTVVEHQIRPDELRAELGIKKDAYYAYLKHLGIKANKDPKGKAYLDPEAANLVRELRVHVEKNGKIETFVRSNSEAEGELAAESEVGSGASSGEALAVGVLAQSAELGQLEQLIGAAAGDGDDDVSAEEIRRIVYGAGQLKAEELILHQAIRQELAAQMTYEDLPEELQVKVRAFRESSGPKFNPAEAASAVLGKWRQMREEPVA